MRYACLLPALLPGVTRSGYRAPCARPGRAERDHDGEQERGVLDHIERVGLGARRGERPARASSACMPVVNRTWPASIRNVGVPRAVVLLQGVAARRAADARGSGAPSARYGRVPLLSRVPRGPPVLSADVVSTCRAPASQYGGRHCPSGDPRSLIRGPPCPHSRRRRTTAGDDLVLRFDWCGRAAFHPLWVMCRGS